ncbi:MAG: DUF5916 domain-containing protein [Acidobacteriota bacterium]|nr:DUF5916 domain-containing protein [Acidobacteriota bacterium]
MPNSHYCYAPIAIFVVFCSALTSLVAQNQKTITALYIDGPIAIDGNLDEPEWDLAQPGGDFIQNEPRTGEPATEPTEVRLLYDDDNLYIGVYCFDSAGEDGITVTEVKRDYHPFDNDHFSFVLDTFNDSRNGFLFGTNPKGGQREGQVEGDGASNNFDWDAIWYVKTKITQQGWQAEFSIPFKTLRFKNIEDQQWNVNFLRVIRRKNEQTYWSALPRPFRLPRVSLAGKLEGLQGIQQGRNLYIKPYLSMPMLWHKKNDIDFSPDAGFDIKYGVTPGLTLDLTINTDFSQVEADTQQINLTRFSLFFPEKREFFLENANLFEFGTSGGGFRARRDLIPFFSRRIGLSKGKVVPIIGGARLTGKIGKYHLGMLSIQTDAFEETPATNFSVIRVKRNILSKSDIGGIFVNKNLTNGYKHRTYGVDVNLNFFQYLDISSYLMKIDTPEISDKDKAANLNVEWNNRFLNLKADYLSIQDNFNPEVGFVPRRGIRKSSGEITFRTRPGKTIPWIRELRPSASMEYITDQNNELETRQVDQNVSMSLESGGFIWFTRRSRFERLDQPFEIRPGQFIPVGDYEFTEYSGSASTDGSRMFSTGIRLRSGGFFGGHKDSVELDVAFRPNYHFTAEIDWNREKLNLASGHFTTNLVATRLDYSFTPQMFLDVLIQYNSTLKEVTSNVRFNFIYKPLSDLFLVYNEKRSTTGDVVDRAIILKLSYLFDF